jgi:large subunit ribosomal protein L13
MIIDASDAIIGRLATVVAKRAMLGESINIVNCEKAVIRGAKKYIIQKNLKRRKLGQPKKGPYFLRKPNFFMRRVIRGMLPYKTARGKEAFSRIRCYTGFPLQFSKEKIEIIKDASNLNRLNTKYVSLGEVCEIIGAKI